MRMMNTVCVRYDVARAFDGDKSRILLMRVSVWTSVCLNIKAECRYIARKHGNQDRNIAFLERIPVLFWFSK